MVSFKDWQNLDLRVGLIKSVEDMEGKDKLYKLIVSFGEEEKTVVSGIKLDYPNKEDLENKKLAFIYNLDPATIAGVESQAMILGAVNEEGKYKLVFMDDSLKEGTKLE
ncbi:MAG: methionine--tRNA ligase subunit beta [Candidatus Diapherotrites archaeon]|mgnify:FL=1|jgi:methionine--tRNA ligase beta chain|nr:methionine--tRNA ligase subunit beta [Candidatus Diapherotrites archaeon]MBT4597233.1 methionine--tRNA ligase subunit beta [Candidatus Diapherotrites archaeon]